MSQEPAAKKKKGHVTVREAWCKGCAICVEFCPEQVLVMERGKATVAYPDRCTACNLCELRCPDFCITVSVKGE
ncbi:MAG TPA: 4Fe-4S dicluster domain-containing protein [bacterium]|nr:4Fe-4S dicluster domain-containing protein [bacterium]HPN36535.1 4Fe-4S dicluster domain-containing protein [bacterium]